MKQRIVAAWKVLRGEWTATSEEPIRPPISPSWVYSPPNHQGTGTNVRVVFTKAEEGP